MLFNVWLFSSNWFFQNNLSKIPTEHQEHAKHFDMLVYSPTCQQICKPSLVSKESKRWQLMKSANTFAAKNSLNNLTFHVYYFVLMDHYIYLFQVAGISAAAYSYNVTLPSIQTKERSAKLFLFNCYCRWQRGMCIKGLFKPPLEPKNWKLLFINIFWLVYKKNIWSVKFRHLFKFYHCYGNKNGRQNRLKILDQI